MKTSERERLRLARKKRVKLKVQKQKSRHRLTVFRSSKHIYAQIVDDKAGKTLVSGSSMTKGFKEQMKTGGNLKAAALVGVSERLMRTLMPEIPHCRIGNRVVIPVAPLAEWLRKKTQEEQSPLRKAVVDILEDIQSHNDN